MAYLDIFPVSKSSMCHSNIRVEICNEQKRNYKNIPSEQISRIRYSPMLNSELPIPNLADFLSNNKTRALDKFGIWDW